MWEAKTSGAVGTSDEAARAVRGEQTPQRRKQRIDLAGRHLRTVGAQVHCEGDSQQK